MKLFLTSIDCLPKAIRRFALLTCLSLTGCIGLFTQQTFAADLRFHPGANGSFDFDTGVLRGTLRSNGKSDGLMSITHVPSGTRLDRSKGLFGIYRVFTANKRYGHGAWDWPSESRLLEDGAVEVHWARAAERPFDLWAVYRWRRADILDLEMKVKAHEDLSAFEAFVASYFNTSFNQCSAYAKTHDGPAFLRATQASGLWHAFARDARAAGIIQDGRWTIEPSPVNWTIRPFYATPIGVRRSVTNDLCAAAMAPARDCFAVLMPQETENHHSLYLSMFGQHVRAGRTATARARLAILEKADNEEIVKVYRSLKSADPFKR